MAVNFKRILADALISLSEEKPLSKITVSDIVARADVGRQTFYNHFKDKNDIIYWIYQRTLAGDRYLVKEKGYLAYYIQVMERAQGIKDFLKSAIKLTGQNSLTGLLYQQNYNYYRNYILENCGQDKITEEVEHALDFNAWGATHVYIKWIMDGAPGLAETQAKWTIDCIVAKTDK